MGQPPIKAIRFKSQILVAIRFLMLPLIAAGYSHTIFLKSDGAVWATGYNPYGQLGDGSTAGKSNPVQVTDSSGNPFSNVAAVAAGYHHTIFLKSDGSVWATGRNNFGQLGDGSTASVKAIRFKSQILVAIRFLMLPLSPPDLIIPSF